MALYHMVNHEWHARTSTVAARQVEVAWWTTTQKPKVKVVRVLSVFGLVPAVAVGGWLHLQEGLTRRSGFPPKPEMNQINDIGLHAILREVALADQDLYAQIDQAYVFDFPLVDAVLLITKDNRTFVFGDNHQEALGFKLQKKGAKIITRIGRPRELEALRGKRIAAVAYRRHVMILTTDGQLYGWGRNDYGPLGLSKGRDFSVRPSMLMENIKKIVTYHHTLVMNNDGQVFVFGLNVDKQVNPTVDDDVQYYAMQVVRIRDRAAEIACTSKASVVLTESNVLHLWGTVKGTVVNLSQSLDQCGKIKKMVALEYLNFDTWILTLNHDRRVHLHRYDVRTGRIISKQIQLHSAARPIVDIIASDHSSFALITDDGQCHIYWNNEGTGGPFDYHHTATQMTSIIDASRLYRIRFRIQSLCQLSAKAKDSAVIQSLKSFNNPADSDYQIGWDPQLQHPVIAVKKSVLVKHCPALKDALPSGSQLSWGQREIHNKLGRFQYQGQNYPSFPVVYGYLTYVYTGQIPANLTPYWDEFLALADYLHDEKLKTELNRVKMNPPASSPASTPPPSASSSSSSSLSGRSSNAKKLKTGNNGGGGSGP